MAIPLITQLTLVSKVRRTHNGESPLEHIPHRKTNHYRAHAEVAYSNGQSKFNRHW